MVCSQNFVPDQDIPDLSEKVIFITGGTAGLGRGSVINLAKHKPEHIYFSGRNAKKASEIIDEVRSTSPDVKVTFVELNLGSLTSIKAAVSSLGLRRLDILICNAGVASMPPGLTESGFEIHFGTNHVGHALLIDLLLPTLQSTAETYSPDVRIVILSSEAYKLAPSVGIRFKELRETQASRVVGPWLCYGQSKLANTLYAAELARRYPSITTVSVHPGTIKTDLVGNMSFSDRMLVYATNIGQMKTPEEGVLNQLWAATVDKKELQNGAYYKPVGIQGKLSGNAANQSLAKELWDWTQEVITGAA